MKECKYCGTIYADNLSACPSCGGTKIVTDEERAEEESLKRKEFENRERASAAPQKQRKALIGGIVAVAVVAIAIIAIVSSNANKPLSNGMTKDEGDQVLTEGIAYFDAGDYEAAMKCFAQLPADSKQYEKAQEMLGKCADEYSTAVVEKASTYATNGEYEVALNLLDNATELLPGNTPISTARNTIFAKYKDAVCTKAFTEAEESVANGDYSSAIKAIDTAIELGGEDGELTAKREVYVTSYISQTVSAAKEQYVEYNCDSILEAENMIEAALDILPNNEILLKELTYYRNQEPATVFDLTNPDFGMQSGGMSALKEFGSVTDNHGTMHNNAISTSSWTNSNSIFSDDCYARNAIDIDYQYSKLTGLLFQSEKYASAPVISSLSVYGYASTDVHNEELLWRGEVSGSSKPVSFNIDLSGYKYIVLWLEQEVSDSSSYYAYLSDLYIWK